MLTLQQKIMRLEAIEKNLMDAQRFQILSDVSRTEAGRARHAKTASLKRLCTVRYFLEMAEGQSAEGEQKIHTAAGRKFFRSGASEAEVAELDAKLSNCYNNGYVIHGWNIAKGRG